MKKSCLFLVSLTVGIGLFFWTLKVVGWQEIKDSLRIFTGWNGFIIVFLTLVMALVGTWKWREILRGENVKISFGKLFNPYLAGYAVMLLAPVIIWGGEILRGYLLKKKNSIPWSKGMASIVIDRIFEWTANLTVMVLGVCFFLSKINIIPQNLEVLFGVLFLFFSAVIVYFYSKVFKKESIIKSLAGFFGLKKIEERSTLIETEKEIFNFFDIKNIFMWKALALSFLRAAVMLARVWFVLLFLGKGIGLAQSLSILGFNYMAVMIPIPAALGSHEAIQTLAFSELGLGRSNATAFTMIIRGSEIIFSLSGLAILFKLGVDFVKNLLFREPGKIADDSKNNGN
ncbi:MAG: lysylphosphatidylglycerol synthase transmembrane domain-containing protein [Patescibacteria group bacterium]